MSDQLIIYLKNINTLEADWVFTQLNGDIRTPVDSGLIAELVDKNKNAITAAKRIVCIVSAELVNFSYLNIPAKNKQRALQAIPFALEDQLAEDIDLMHFATDKADQNTYPVAAIKHESMQSILSTLKDNGIEPDCLYPDILCLPNIDNSWNFLSINNTTAINLKRDTIIHTDSDMLPVILQTLLQQTEKENLPASFEYWSSNSEEIIGLDIPDDITLNRHQYSSSPITVFCTNLSNDSLVNLLQGKYQVKKQSTEWWKPWRAAAVLFAAVILLELFSGTLKLNSLEDENRLLSTEINSIYKKSFPASKRVVNARVQMENKLKQLRNSNGKQNLSFTDILASAAPILKQQSSLQIQDINYRNNKLEMQFTIDNVSSAESLKDQLNKLQNIKADLLSTSSETKQVQARIKLEAI